MIIFLNDDQAYHSWIAHHRGGFVLDGRRRPKVGHLLLHRATCSDVARSSSGRQRCTTGTRIKATSLARQELIAWAVEQTGKAVVCCGTCQPDLDLPMPRPSAKALPKLSRDILDYVLEAALIHMEHQQPPYRLTIGDIAACFGKPPGRVAPLVGRLIDEGWLMLIGKQSKSAKWMREVIAPTVLAMRSLAAFETEGDTAIETELKKLDVKLPSRSSRSTSSEVAE